MPINWLEPGRVSAHLLDQSLRDWEDRVLTATVFLKGLVAGNAARPSIIRGPLVHRSDMRQYVFNKTAHFDSSLDFERFQVTEDLRLEGRDAIVKALGLNDSTSDPDKENMLEIIDNGIVPDLINWGRDSRRVFSVSKDSARIFANIPYNSFVWDDVLMPFPSFMIELADTPFLVLGPEYMWRTLSPKDPLERGMLLLHGILVTHPASLDPSFPNDEFCCRAFLSDPHRAEPYSVALTLTSEMRKLSRIAIKGDQSAFARFLAQIADHRRLTQGVYKATGLPFRVSLSETIKMDDLDDGTNIIRGLVAGLCLYLAHAPGEIIGEKDIQGTVWKDPRKGDVATSAASSHAIRDVLRTFSVERVHEFNPKTGFIRYQSSGGSSVSAHARRAHLRRPMRSPLTAPKIIKVRSTWVNRIGRSMLPFGAATIVR